MIVTRAPLRIPLGGGGTDFPSYYQKYGGFVLGFATNLYVYVVIHPTKDGKIHLKYSKNEVVDSLEELKNRNAAECIKYVEDSHGKVGGIEICTFSDVPESSGLGGSSAFCTALLLGLYTLKEVDRDPGHLWKDAYLAERLYAGQPGGIQDQWFATFGNAYALELGQSVHSKVIDVGGLVGKLKLVYTHKHRDGLEIAVRQDSQVEEKNLRTIRSLDSIKAVGKMIESLLVSGEYEEIGKTFNTHWEQKILRDPEIATPEILSLRLKCLEKGAVGAKLIGLGGGGYLLVYTEKELEGLKTWDLGVDTEGAKVLFSSERREVCV